ncbi:MAG: sialate O-acetylesterase [Clostridiales bacterium]|nr:sialate O-acetylesterase [Clostridiales bacterium]MCC8065666.1 sialate O-acetylesterase [Clostridiales bacterium]
MDTEKDFSIPKLLGPGCVLQRGEKTRVWGWAPPGASVEIVLLKQKEKTVVARCAATADADGTFTSYFEGLKAGGPYILVFWCREEGAEIQETPLSADGDTSASQSERGIPFVKAEVPDVWVGDVFVCAGQSNMELPMSRVREKYPEEFLNGGCDRVHVYKVQEAYNFKREASEHAHANWNLPFAETSAFSYFLGKELSQREGVPIGILNLSLGGTPIQAWMSEDALEAWPDYQRERVVLSDDEYCRTLTAQKAEEEAAWQKALCEKEREAWPPRGTSLWQPIRLPGSLAEAGLVNFCGSVMLRKKFSVSDDQAGKKALLRLGTLADADRAYINGVLVGETGYRYPPRRYTVPEGVLQTGENELLIHLVCRNGDGRMTKGKTVELAWEDVCDDNWPLKHCQPGSEASAAAQPAVGQREGLFSCEKISAPIPLEGEWEYLVLAKVAPAPEQVFLNRGATGLFREMVAPALAYTVKGVVWYQGESNDGRPEEYAKLLPAMISNWRRRWMQESLPFVIVQLPNCGIDIAMETADGELPWPMIREAQRRAGDLPDVAVTVNLDIGEDNDLHPLNKKEAARRAALALRKIVYHEDVICSGPELYGWEKHTDGLMLRFDRPVIFRNIQNPGSAEDVLANSAADTQVREFSAADISVRENSAADTLVQDISAGKESAEKTRIPDGLFELYCEDAGWLPAKAELHCGEIRLQPVFPADAGSSVKKSAGRGEKLCGEVLPGKAVRAESILAVRYAWSNAPGSRLLYGEEGLCVTPFCERLRCTETT